MSEKYKSKFTEVIYNSLDELNKNTINFFSILLKAKSCILKIILQIYKVRRYITINFLFIHISLEMALLHDSVILYFLSLKFPFIKCSTQLTCKSKYNHDLAQNR